jgi:hypothetical protein
LVHSNGRNRQRPIAEPPVSRPGMHTLPPRPFGQMHQPKTPLLRVFAQYRSASPQQLATPGRGPCSSRTRRSGARRRAAARRSTGRPATATPTCRPTATSRPSGAHSGVCQANGVTGVDRATSCQR